MNTQYEYDVALSFAGEDRVYVEKVATILRSNNIKVFYDGFEEINLWGKNLYTHLSDIYRDKANYTIIFISEHYAKKLWTSHERENAQARAFKENREYILPARFDNTQIPGILDTTGYIDLTRYSPEKFAFLICSKVRSNFDPEAHLKFLNNQLSKFRQRLIVSMELSDLKRLLFDVKEFKKKYDSNYEVDELIENIELSISFQSPKLDMRPSADNIIGKIFRKRSTMIVRLIFTALLILLFFVLYYFYFRYTHAAKVQLSDYSTQPGIRKSDTAKKAPILPTKIIPQTNDSNTFVGDTSDINDENLIPYVCQNGKRGYKNRKTGKEIIPCKYDRAQRFKEELAWVLSNQKYGFIDKRGESITPFKYDDVNSFSEGLASVKLKHKWGFIDRNGREIVPFIFDTVDGFKEGIAKVLLNGKLRFIDKTGKEVGTCRYDDMTTGKFHVNNVYYDEVKATLSLQAINSIDSIVHFMTDNPVFSLDIYVVDNASAKDFTLSQRRAQSIFDYMEKNGIDRKRLTAKGSIKKSTKGNIPFISRAEFRITCCIPLPHVIYNSAFSGTINEQLSSFAIGSD